MSALNTAVWLTFSGDGLPLAVRALLLGAALMALVAIGAALARP
jgi:hypothetical protein